MYTDVKFEALLRKGAIWPIKIGGTQRAKRKYYTNGEHDGYSIRKLLYTNLFVTMYRLYTATKENWQDEPEQIIVVSS